MSSNLPFHAPGLRRFLALPAAPRARGGAAAQRAGLPLLFGFLLLFAALPSIANAQPISKEYRLKAAFLYNFTKFVSWPADRFADDTSPIVIAVLGTKPFEQELTELVKDRSVDGRPIRIRAIQSAAQLDGAHVVFLHAGEETRLPASLFDAAGVLTVGESSDFTRRGGIITFVVADEKVRFEINQGAAEQAGLKISGQLLKLATVVRKSP